MQTDVFLQKALVNEVKEELEGYTSVNNAGEYLNFNVYPQNLPAKKSKNDDDHFHIERPDQRFDPDNKIAIQE